MGHGEHPEDAKDEKHLGVEHLVGQILVKNTKKNVKIGLFSFVEKVKFRLTICSGNSFGTKVGCWMCPLGDTRAARAFNLDDGDDDGDDDDGDGDDVDDDDGDGGDGGGGGVHRVTAGLTMHLTLAIMMVVVAMVVKVMFMMMVVFFLK